MANLEEYRSRIPDAWSIILNISWKTTFYLTKTEKITKKFQHNRHIFPPKKR